jgi:S1-C subfamily serine protease
MMRGMPKFPLSFVPAVILSLLVGCAGAPDTQPAPTPAPAPIVAAPVAATPSETPPADAKPGLGFMPDYQAGVEGVAVGGVREGSPAAKAGIQEGDVILMLNGIRVTDAQSYTEALDEQKVGATVPVQIQRGGEKLELKVTIGTRRR